MATAGPVMSLHDIVRRFLDDLAPGVNFALVGGLAVGARAGARFTRDADFAIAVTDDAEAERIVFGLQSHRYSTALVLEHAETGRMATVRLHPPAGSRAGVIVDLLFSSCGIEPEVVAAAEPLELLPGLVLPVARVGHLLAMKLLAHDPARRPQDAVDILALLAEADEADLELCRVAIRLIEERGYARGKVLDRELKEFLARASGTPFR